MLHMMILFQPTVGMCTSNHQLQGEWTTRHVLYLPPCRLVRSTACSSGITCTDPTSTCSTSISRYVYRMTQRALYLPPSRPVRSTAYSSGITCTDPTSTCWMSISRYVYRTTQHVWYLPPSRPVRSTACSSGITCTDPTSTCSTSTSRYRIVGNFRGWKFSRFKGKSLWNNFCDFYFRDFKWTDLCIKWSNKTMIIIMTEDCDSCM